MKKVFTLLIIFILLSSAACSSSPKNALSEDTSVQSTASKNSTFQNESFFSVYHSVLNPENDDFLNSNPLDEMFLTDFSTTLSSDEEKDVLQEYINLWSFEMSSAETKLKSLLNNDAATAFDDSKTAWENELEKDLASFSETYLSFNGNGSDIGIYTGYLMLEKVRTRVLELIDQILFFGGDYAFSQTGN